MVLDSGIGTVSEAVGACIGYITASQTELSFLIPMARVVKSTPTLNALSLICRYADGGYPYIRSGTNGATYTALGSNPASLWTNGAATRSNEISKLTVNHSYEGIHIQIVFKYQICKTSGSTAAVTNNVPVEIQPNVNFTF